MVDLINTSPASSSSPAFTALGFDPASGSGPAFIALGFCPAFIASASGSGPAFTALGFGPASGSGPAFIALGFGPTFIASGFGPASGSGPTFTALGFDLTSASGPAFTFGFQPYIELRSHFWASAPLSGFGLASDLGTRRSRAKCDARVHTSSRTPIRSFFLYFSREGPDKEVPPMKPTTEASERAACLQCNNLNRQTNMPIGFESTPLRRTTDAGATSTIGDDDYTRRPPQVTLTMKIRALTFIIQTETTSNIIRPR
ncbi:hypothetical protein CRG98_034158 [Punica granatum]|uniref:Uncharacterized protein n=1 Tax=Punica granatum TaxID=22663 RepID=A0A2I0IN56_PUNGR|nr:hypothetical protein CRG98_034158 [Punica granatum]